MPHQHNTSGIFIFFSVVIWRNSEAWGSLRDGSLSKCLQASLPRSTPPHLSLDFPLCLLQAQSGLGTRCSTQLGSLTHRAGTCTPEAIELGKQLL